MFTKVNICVLYKICLMTLFHKFNIFKLFITADFICKSMSYYILCDRSVPKPPHPKFLTRLLIIVISLQFHEPWMQRNAFLIRFYALLCLCMEKCQKVMFAQAERQSDVT